MNKKDILLVMAPPWETKMPPLGLAYIDQYLVSKGLKTQIYDLNVKLHNCGNSELKKIWRVANISYLKQEEIAEKIFNGFKKQIFEFIDYVVSLEIDIIGFSVNYFSLVTAEKIALYIKGKNPKKKIIFGGPGIFWDYNRVALKNYAVDMFVIGDGEKTLYEVIKNYKKYAKLIQIPGTIVKTENRYTQNVSAQFIKDLKTLPYPKFEKFNLSEYAFEIPEEIKNIPILFSRGCIGKCSFCIDHKMCGYLRTRPPEDIINEIQYHMDNNKIVNFAVNDLLCNGDIKHLEKVCDLIIEKDININLTSYAMIRKDMNPEVLRKMKKAGFIYLCYGLESGSDKTLKFMNKYYNSAIAKKVIQDTAKSGIKTAVNIIVGHPGENKKEFKKTIKFLKKNKEYINQITNVSTCFINPSASLGLNPEKYGIVLKDTNNLFDKIKALAGRVLDLMLFSKESWDYAEHSGLKKYFFREINYSDFYDIYGNTPLTRRKKLFKMLSCIYKMNLPVIIVNKPIAVDKKLEKIINKVTDFNKKALSKFKAFKDIKIVQADTGVQIYYKGSEITKKFGINSSLFTKNQGWVDSSWAVWNFNKSNKKNVISAKVIWNKIPVVQLWQIKIINSEKIYLKIIMEVKKDFYLSIRKVGILINDKYDVFEYANNKSIFPDFQKDWSVINLNQPGLDKITVKNSKSDIPDLTVKFLNNNFNCGFQIETGDRRTRAKIISLVEKHNNFIKITKGSYPYFEGLMSFS